MVGSADLWVLAGTFVLCWYSLGVASCVANEGRDKRQLRIMFFGNRGDEGLAWWGVALMTGVTGMTVAAGLVMLLALDPI